MALRDRRTTCVRGVPGLPDIVQRLGGPQLLHARSDGVQTRERRAPRASADQGGARRHQRRRGALERVAVSGVLLERVVVRPLWNRGSTMFVMILATLTVIGTLLSDILLLIIDPRIRYEKVTR